MATWTKAQVGKSLSPFINCANLVFTTQLESWVHGCLRRRCSPSQKERRQRYINRLCFPPLPRALLLLFAPSDSSLLQSFTVFLFAMHPPSSSSSSSSFFLLLPPPPLLLLFDLLLACISFFSSSYPSSSSSSFFVPMPLRPFCLLPLNSF